MEYNLGKALKTIREAKHLTQKQLAEMVNVEPSTISKIECGSSSPSIDVFRQIVLALKINSDILLEIADANNETSDKYLIEIVNQINKTKTVLENLTQYTLLQSKRKPGGER